MPWMPGPRPGNGVSSGRTRGSGFRWRPPGRRAGADQHIGQPCLETGSGVPAGQPAQAQGDPGRPVRGHGAVLMHRQDGEGDYAGDRCDEGGRRSPALSAAADGAGPTARRRLPVSRNQGQTRRSAIAGGRVFASRRQPRCAELAQQVPFVPAGLSRLGASVPRPHVTSPEPAAHAHAARARCRRPAVQCPAPTAAWVRAGTATDTHSSVPEGLVPSMAEKTSCRYNRALR
jgi:hypothetical protein